MRPHTRSYLVLIACVLSACHAPAPAADYGGDVIRQAKSLRKSGKYAQAENLLVATIRNSQRSQHSESIAACLDVLADIYSKDGKLTEAEETLKTLMQMREKALWPEHPYVTDVRFRLEELYLKRGDYNAAAALIQRDIELDEMVLGNDDPRTVIDLTRLMLCRKAQKRYDETALLAERILAVQKRTLHAGDPHLNDTIVHLCDVYVAQGRFDLCEPLLKQFLASPITDSINLAISIRNIGDQFLKLGKYSLAESLYERALKTLPNGQDKDFGLQFAATLESLAKCKIQLHNEKAAAALLRQASALRKRWTGPKV